MVRNGKEKGFAYREVLDKNRDELFLINREGRALSSSPKPSDSTARYPGYKVVRNREELSKLH